MMTGILAMAKFGMGSTIMLGVGSYVADGRITGGGPGDTNLRKIYLDSGWKPYSFVFQPGEWDAEFVDYLKGMKIDPSIGTDQRLYVPFRGIDPLAGPVAMMEDAFSAIPLTPIKPSADGVITPTTNAWFKPVAKATEAEPWSGVSIATQAVRTRVVASVLYSETNAIADGVALAVIENAAPSVAAAAE